MHINIFNFLFRIQFALVFKLRPERISGRENLRKLRLIVYKAVVKAGLGNAASLKLPRGLPSLLLPHHGSKGKHRCG